MSHQRLLKQEAQRLSAERKANDPIEIKYGCTVYFNKAGAIIAVGWPVEGNKFQLVESSTTYVFKSQLEASEFLRTSERLKAKVQ